MVHKRCSVLSKIEGHSELTAWSVLVYAICLALPADKAGKRETRGCDWKQAVGRLAEKMKPNRVGFDGQLGRMRPAIWTARRFSSFDRRAASDARGCGVGLKAESRSKPQRAWCEIGPIGAGEAV